MSFCFSWPLRMVLDGFAKARNYGHRQIFSFSADSVGHFRSGEIVANYGQPIRVQNAKTRPTTNFVYFYFTTFYIRFPCRIAVYCIIGRPRCILWAARRRRPSDTRSVPTHSTDFFHSIFFQIHLLLLDFFLVCVFTAHTCAH